MKDNITFVNDIKITKNNSMVLVSVVKTIGGIAKL